MASVGSIVRVQRAEPLHRYRGRAMVATTSQDQGHCVVFWEPLAPQPLAPSASFLVSPLLPKISDSEEFPIDAEQVDELFPFENESTIDCVDESKIRGDELLKFGDPGSAIPYYEHALKHTSHVSIGSSIVVSVEGFPKIAEVDCVDEKTVDVLFVESQEERTISKDEILIGISETEGDDNLQERILLNLARCLIQHSEVDTRHRAKYLRAAVLACSLCLAIAQFHQDSDRESSTPSLPDTAQTSLVLRIKAQCSVGKWPHATADAKQLIKCGNSQGAKLLESIKRQKKQQEKKDKKLVKAVSRWVQTATTASVSPNSEEESQSPERNVQAMTLDASKRTPEADSKQPFSLSSPFLIFMAITIALLIQNLNS